jgi:uroporphyrinogen-III decarboxylase
LNLKNEELYEAREKRFVDAITLQKPDRVPILPLFGSFPTRYAGITHREEFLVPAKFTEANLKAVIDFEPDVAVTTPMAGWALAPLGWKQMKWGGHGLDSDYAGIQWVEGEHLLPEEYDEFIHDPADFVIRRFWPRVFGKMGLLAHTPPLRGLIDYFSIPFALAPFGTPEGIAVLDTLKEAGAAALQGVIELDRYTQKLKEAGFPQAFLSGTQAPFDFIGDFLRGRKGVMLDMYRCPEKLIATAEKLLPMAIEKGIMGAKMSGNPRVFIALHGCVEGFMSVEQFKTFYWPTFRALLWGLAEAGLYPVVLCEGNNTSRLHLMKDVPAGKICYIFQYVDWEVAKSELAGTVCMAGNVPLPLLSIGTPDEVRAYCKTLIATMGADGGYIMSAGGSMDDARPENVRAMFDATREYGVY